MRPSRAPAGIGLELQRAAGGLQAAPPHVLGEGRHRRSWAIFGSLTKVPAPRLRMRYPSRTSSSRAARTVSRETPRSVLSCRSDLDRLADRQAIDEVEDAVPRIGLLRHSTPAASTVEACASVVAGSGLVMATPVTGSKKWKPVG